jgi:diadenylate cyclase
MSYIINVFGFIWDNIRTIGVSDILDIAVVAFCIYKAVTFFSRTGAGRVLRGVVLMLLLMWVASLLKLTVVNYFIGHTLQVGILLLVIVFQPELRHVLERVGSSEISMVFSAKSIKNSEKEAESLIASVTSACADLSRSYTGALIVFERKMKLEDTVKTGTIIEANVSSDLLKNIFYPKTPLHDGAVIIRDGRIAAAACMLSLSRNPNIDRNLGTRHRAAIGITETSDAAVIVVSEETGGISFASGGMLKRRLTPETVGMLLRAELIEEDAVSKTATLLERVKMVTRRAKQ